MDPVLLISEDRAMQSLELPTGWAADPQGCPSARGRPGAAGAGAAVDKGLTQSSASAAGLRRRRREGDASEALEMFKLHRRGIKL